jgi:hypothetical protein
VGAAKRDEIKVTDSDVEEHEMGENLERLNENLARVEELSKRLVAALSSRDPGMWGLEGPGQDLYMKASAAYWNEAMTNPSRLLEHQVEYWGKTLTHFLEMQQNLSHGQFVAPEDDPGSGGRQTLRQPVVEDASLFQLREASVPAWRQGDRGCGRDMKGWMRPTRRGWSSSRAR